jgi:hypothetical protein
MEDDTRMAYVAKKRDCGCIVGATVDMPQHCKETAKDVARWIREGFIVERMESESVRLNWHDCTHKPTPPALPKLPMFPALDED